MVVTSASGKLLYEKAGDLNRIEAKDDDTVYLNYGMGDTLNVSRTNLEKRHLNVVRARFCVICYRNVTLFGG